MSDQPPSGPSDATLRFLQTNLPSFVNGIAKRRLHGKGKPVNHQKPRKWCRACGTAFDFGPMKDEDPIEKGVCDECMAKLIEGQACCTDERRFAFCVPTENLKDFAGQIVSVSPKVIDEIEKIKFGSVKTIPFPGAQSILPEPSEKPDEQSGPA